MNWKNEAVNDLKAYNHRKAAIENMTERIRLLDERIVALRSASCENSAVMGTKRTNEDRWLENIYEREQLELSRKFTEALVELTERGLAALDSRERRVLDCFYINRSDDYMDTLCDELHFEKSRLYQIKDKAVQSFTAAMYGSVPQFEE